MKSRYIFYIIIVLIIVILMGRYEQRARHGFCFEQGRYLSGQELAHSAALSIFQRYKRGANIEPFTDRNEEPIKFDDFEYFHSISQITCWSPIGNGWKARKKEPYSGGHSYRTKCRYIFIKMGMDHDIKASVAMNACGLRTVITRSFIK